MKSILLYLAYFLTLVLSLSSVELKELKQLKLIMFNIKAKYENAHQLCKSVGYNLIRIENEKSFSLINNLTVLFQVGKYWLDVNDIKNENVFVHSDGSSMKYKKFDIGQPDNMGSREHCVEGFFQNLMVMNDWVCSEYNGVICYKGSFSADNIEISYYLGTYIIFKNNINFEEKCQYSILDGLCLMRNNFSLINQQMKKLAQIFKMKDNGDISYSIRGKLDNNQL